MKQFVITFSYVFLKYAYSLATLLPSLFPYNPIQCIVTFSTSFPWNFDFSNVVPQHAPNSDGGNRDPKYWNTSSHFAFLMKTLSRQKEESELLGRFWATSEVPPPWWSRLPPNILKF